MLAAERLDALGARRVDLSGGDSGFAVTTLGRSAGARLGALGRVVGDDECVEEVALDEEFRGGEPTPPAPMSRMRMVVWSVQKVGRFGTC
ncbi:hypothetical protein DEAB109302_09125 [Dermacoccus abyssi]